MRLVPLRSREDKSEEKKAIVGTINQSHEGRFNKLINAMIVLIAFSLLLLWTLCHRFRWRRLLDKSGQDWLLDSSNLFIQGTAIPWLQTAVFVVLLQAQSPQYQGSVQVGLIGGFFLNFLVVDYIYYWNHRLLHSSALWKTHLVHHSVTEMDVFATSRNTLWTSFLICYLWINSLALFFLDDPRGYLVAAAITASLDLWKHSELQPWSWLSRVLGLLLILPRDHAWHHGLDESYGNYGANLKIWDQLHGTWHSSTDMPEKLGVSHELNLLQKLVWPFS
jgi:sterol desaturase/sphingolipid hydroxylase (fatty acid hydroxylase superfamily)